ncbi:hypothetical protein SAMN04487848_1172 [Microbacterium sp. ru370.1]|uniref:hypothetical protein n=1 Tax=unclassified Microbacterium TaxID=2609290 RepID=UPI0008913E77|nr:MULTISPECIES: hypothetical protein [unclassified Microbacterium]SDO49685.1 hypothetical protein SAMN04487848_1172 [Microbacterium sp. ru370.1]SIT82821.1 hypothetical protein SAMN05880579_1168 [Microbacterium sp. RU1D]
MTVSRRRSLRARLVERRARAGDGRPLAPFRWWQVLSRSQLSISIPDADGSTPVYTVDVRQLGDGADGVVRARLYRDGALSAVSRLPARFAVPGGHIEVAAGTYGLRRCHLVPAVGPKRQLTPHPRSAEGRRASFDRDHPRASRVVGILSLVLVVGGVGIAVPQLLETLSQLPVIVENVGTFTAPLRLPPAVNVGVTVVVALGSVERALRLRSSWLDDLAT